MKKFCVVSFIYFLIFSFAQGQTMYVSPTGNAALNGQDINNPTTLTHAISLLTSSTTTAVTIYLRGGTYTMTAGISLAASRSGTAANIKNLFAYPGDPRPVLDFSTMTRATTTVTGVRGVSFSPSYWYIKGIDFFNASDNGLYMSGSNNKVEFCFFYENQDTGLQMGGGASNNQVINCDSYYNVDPSQGNADGYAAKLDVGTGNAFSGCRAWQNSDDGWDGYLRPSDDISTTLDNCWAFKNGYLKSGAVATNGNGNGFKMGGSDLKDLRNNMTLTRCLAFQNKVRGFDQNNNRGSMILQNCTSWNNGQNYGMNSSGVTLAAGKVMTLTNCISLTTTSANVFNAAATFATNSWTSGFSVSAADFQSIDPTAAYGARQADGSLPNITFMHLTTTSALRDRGTNVGLAFNGSAPDLGAFETTESLPITLLSFSAIALKEKNSIHWATSSERNNALFLVERSADGLDFSTIHETKGAGKTETPQYYTVFDDNPLKGINYYRLRQRDFDGKETVSKIVSVNTILKSTDKFKAYPSVTSQFLTIETPFEENATIKIIDNLGRIVLSKKIDKIGSTSINLDVHGLTNGLYILVLETGFTQMTERFLKQ